MTSAILKKYTSVSTSSSTMRLSRIVLRQTKTTRLIFYPAWVEESKNPLRGGFLFQKKSPIQRWENIPHKPLTTLKKDEEYSLTLKGEEVIKLISELKNINFIYHQRGHKQGLDSVQVLPGNVSGIFMQISDPNKKKIIKDGIKSLSIDQINNFELLVKSIKLKKIINTFENNLNNTDENFWQSYFEKNSEILQHIFAFPVIYLNGETYLGGKNTKGRQGSGGTATDFLMKNSSNGSFGVVDIKTPGCKLVGGLYRGIGNPDNKNEVYGIHSDLTGGIVQLENQILVATEYFKTHIGEDYKDINFLNPFGVLVAGNQSGLTPVQKKSFNLFRKSLGKNQIYTFDEILVKLKLIKKTL